MSKAFTSEETEDLPPLWRAPPALLPGQRRHITASGHRALLERRAQWDAERSALAQPGAWQHAERLRQLDASLEALDRTLALLTVAEAPALDDPHVRLGSVVTLKEGDRTRRLRVVGPDELGDGTDRLSVDSPLGKALLGAVAGEERDVELPRGEVVLRVAHVDQRA